MTFFQVQVIYVIYKKYKAIGEFLLDGFPKNS